MQNKVVILGTNRSDVAEFLIKFLGFGFEGKCSICN